MASEIRVNRLSNRSGLSTITFANGGVQFSGITTFANGEFYVGTGATIMNPSSNEMQFHTGGSNRLTINNSGANLGTGNITAVDATFSGNVSIGKTLTYEDVKNVDSVGVVTARTGVKITGGDFTVGTAITASSVTGNVTQDVGITTFSGSATWFKGTTANKDMYWSKSSGSLVFKDSAAALFGDGSDLQLLHNGTNSVINNTTGSLLFQNGGSSSAWINSSGVIYTNNDILFQGASSNVVWDKSENYFTFPDKIAVHTGDSNTAIRFPANDTVTVETAGSERLRIDSSGRIGIGIADPDAYQSSSNDFVFGKTNNTGGMTIRSGTGNGGYIRFADGTTGNQAYRGTIAYVHDGDYMMFATDSTEKLRIASDGKVSVGTVQTTHLLSTIGGSSNQLLVQGTEADIWLTSTGGSTTTWRILGSTGGSTHQFRIYDATNSRDAFTISNDGNIGVYGIPVPSFSAINDVAAGDVRGIEIFRDGTDTGTALKLAGDNGAGTKAWSQLGYSGENGTAHWANYNTAGTLQGQIIIGSSGNIGIGDRTSNPGEKLHVHTATGEVVVHVEGATDSKIKLTSHSGDSIIQFGDASSGNAANLTYDHGTDDLIYNRSGEKLRITSAGAIVASSASGYHADADDLVLKERSGGNVGMTFLNTNDSSFGVIYFGDTSDNNAGRIQYDHGNDSLDLFTAGTERVSIASDGSTTVSGALSVTGNTNLSSELRANANIRMTNAGPKITFVDSNNNPDYEVGNSDGVFRIRDTTNSVNRLTIATDGKATFSNKTRTTSLGVGTVPDDHMGIHILQANPRILLKSSGTNAAKIFFGDSSSTDPGVIEYSHSANTMYFGTNNNGNRLAIDSTGKVKIGGGTASLALLHIAPADFSLNLQNNSSNESKITFSKNSLPNDSRSWIKANGEINGYIKFGVGDADRVTITSGGGVHIGNTFSAHTAADNLVVGASSGSNGMTILSGVATGSIFFNDGSGNEGVIQYIHSGTEHMRIKSEGYVKFDVGGGTDTMKIDSDGYVTKPNTPWFHVQGSPSISNSPHDNGLKSFASVHSNNGSHYNNSTGVFTCPVAGFYFFSAGIWSSNSDANNGVNYALLYKKDSSNGSAVQIAGANHHDQWGQLTMAAGFYCAVGDQIYVFYNGSIQGSTPRNYFSGCLLA